MKRNKLVKKVVIAAISGVMVLSLGSIAFAEDISTSTENATGKFRKGFAGRFYKGFMGGAKVNSEKLVEDGIISQEQADKIAEFVKQKFEGKKAEHDKIKAMTKEERAAYISENFKNKPDLMSELISAGIINEEEAASITALLPNKSKEGFYCALTK